MSKPLYKTHIEWKEREKSGSGRKKKEPREKHMQSTWKKMVWRRMNRMIDWMLVLFCVRCFFCRKKQRTTKNKRVFTQSQQGQQQKTAPCDWSTLHRFGTILSMAHPDQVSAWSDRTLRWRSAIRLSTPVCLRTDIWFPTRFALLLCCAYVVSCL